VARAEKKASRLPLSPMAVAGLLRELRAAAADEKPLVVAGARALAEALRRELTRGGVASAVREQGPLDGAAALVYVLADEVGEEDERVLREADRARLPIVCVLAGPVTCDAEIPYVLAENVIRAGAGSGFPIDAIARRLAHVLGERATPLAARLPGLRRPVCEELISRFARQNALIGAAVFIPGADLPALTLNQIRLVLRIADAHGFEVDRERLPELLAVIGSGLGFRAVARQALGLVPVAGWAVKGGVAYAGTRTLGEAAMRYLERRAPVTRVAGGRARFPR
jgi:uncharacterized protein (DUF697 family)